MYGTTGAADTVARIARLQRQKDEAAREISTLEDSLEPRKRQLVTVLGGVLKAEEDEGVSTQDIADHAQEVYDALNEYLYGIPGEAPDIQPCAEVETEEQRAIREILREQGSRKK